MLDDILGMFCNPYDLLKMVLPMIQDSKNVRFWEILKIVIWVGAFAWLLHRWRWRNAELDSLLAAVDDEDVPEADARQAGLSVAGVELDEMADHSAYKPRVPEVDGAAQLVSAADGAAPRS